MTEAKIKKLIQFMGGQRNVVGNFVYQFLSKFAIYGPFFSFIENRKRRLYEY
jgi:hypothetical protein